MQRPLRPHGVELLYAGTALGLGGGCSITAPLFFVVNPMAGRGRAGRLWPELEAAARRMGLSFEYEISRGPLTIIGFVRQALRAGAETIVAVGGDGTVNEAVNGFFLGDERLGAGASLAIVPMGSSSDLARSLGVPDGCAALGTLRNRAVAIDLGRGAFTSAAGRPTLRYFLNNADVGMGARIAAIGSRLKWVGGPAAFFLASLAAAAQPAPWTGTLTVDDAPSEVVDALTVVVALGPFTGGGMHIAPDAKCDDGWFDVVTIESMGPAELLANLPRVYTGDHLSHARVRHVRARRVAIEPDGHPPIELDGEVVGAGGAEFRILAGAIQLHV